MKRFKVDYTIFDNEYPTHIDKSEIIEAESLDSAREIIENRTNFESEFCVNHIELAES